MNEFLQQFLVESRELVEQASDDLLALEAQPQARDRLDGAFRAFHTLKGAAAIVDFDAMARALHAAEDILSAARAGQEPVTPKLVGDGLACLDQVLVWLDEMERSGEPPAEADAQAEAIVRRFSGTATPARAQAPRAEADPDSWLDRLRARCPTPPAGAVAIRWIPDRDCFFRGEDPLAVIAALPGVIALELAGVEPWPALEALDPFACNLDLSLVTTAAPDAIRAVFATAKGPVTVRPLVAAAAGGYGPSGVARTLLEAQVLLLTDPAGEMNEGRIGSAARVALNVLRACGLAEDASAVDRLAARTAARADPQPLLEALQRILLGQPAAVADSAEPPEPIGRAPQEPVRTLRVEAERVDALVNLAGELTVAKNALGHAAAVARDGADPAALAELLKSQHAVLDRLVGELQRSVLQMRVLPLRFVFQRFPRLVREMAANLGKAVRFETEGDATEADKAVVEALFEPLLHVLRNAIDHGVEPGEARTAAGKPPGGAIVLRGRREGDQVVVEVEDDGRGVDPDRIRRAAAERGMATQAALAALSDAAATALIFEPGFSTAEAVSDLSGRGVGMDAVRTAVERIGGRVDLESRKGQGTTVRFTLPFSVMMTPVMTVEVSGQMFGVPLDAVVETVRLPRDRISPVGAARAIVHRDRTLPLIDLARALGGAGDRPPSALVDIVVVSAAGQFGAVEVDRLGERMDVMLKPLDGLLAETPGVVGATLLGDGRVLLVLDLQELL
jgi:two-component system chemotaxis sensor kinase CheA